MSNIDEDGNIEMARSTIRSDPAREEIRGYSSLPAQHDEILEGPELTMLHTDNSSMANVIHNQLVVHDPKGYSLALWQMALQGIISILLIILILLG